MEYQYGTNIVDYEKMGRRILKQRKAKQLTQERLAMCAGISLSFLGHIERGTRAASVETLARLSKALELDMHYVVFGYPSGYSATPELIQELRELLKKY